MTTKTAVITGSIMAVVAVGAVVLRNQAAPVPQAASACPTARPLPTYAPTPASAYCTEKRFYAMDCGSSPGQWMRKWQTAPGFVYQGCGAHTWIVADPDGHDYPIVDQGPNGFRYGKPPNAGPAQESWHQCWDLHNPPAGGYDCSRTGTGIALYQDKTLAQIPQPPHDNWATIYGCCTTPSPTVTPVPATPGGPTKTPPPAVTSQYICVTVTPVKSARLLSLPDMGCTDQDPCTEDELSTQIAVYLRAKITPLPWKP